MNLSTVVAVLCCYVAIAICLVGDMISTHVALMSPVRIMRFVRHSDIGAWDCWVAMDKQQTGDYGTFYRLYDDGAMERYTLDGESNISVVLVKKPDKET